MFRMSRKFIVHPEVASFQFPTAVLFQQRLLVLLKRHHNGSQPTAISAVHCLGGKPFLTSQTMHKVKSDVTNCFHGKL